MTAVAEAPRLAGLDWPGSTVAILASGPSLDFEQCEYVRQWRHGGDDRRVIVVNNTYQRAAWADVLYACDAPWWEQFHADVRARFTGQLWTQDERARHAGLHYVESQRLDGLGKRPGVIHQGGNGGYQAINLAYQAGAKRIALLGFDMHGTHWHGPHANGLPNTPPYLFKTWMLQFDRLAADLKAEGVSVVNCTPYSQLQAFRRGDLCTVLR